MEFLSIKRQKWTFLLIKTFIIVPLFYTIVKFSIKNHA